MQVYYQDKLRGRLHDARQHLQGTGWIDFIIQEAERKGESRVFAKRLNRAISKHELTVGFNGDIAGLMAMELRLLEEDDVHQAHHSLFDEITFSWLALNPQTPLEFEAIFDSRDFESYD